MCKRPAEWVLYGDMPGSETFSCTRHLSRMVADDTTEIHACKYDDECGQCCHLTWLEAVLLLLRGFCETMWWSGPPVDWDEQVREAVADD